MIKVPGTAAGVPAIRALIEAGLNINVTLLFSIEAYQAVAEAHLAGLEARIAKGQPIDRIASVASFFVSRIDTQIDKKIAALEAAGGPKAAEAKPLAGKIAIANAKLAYDWYLDLIASPRWKALAAKGAMPQRLLWASTGVKNPDYRDVLYIETLIGPDTVNTVPPKTLDAFRDHGEVAPTLAAGLDEARAVLDKAQALGLDLPGVTTALVADGVKQFSDAADTLLAAVEEAARLCSRRRELARRLIARPQQLEGFPAMKIGVIGLGRMGANIVRRLIRGGHEVVVHNRSPEPVQELAKEGAIASTDLPDMQAKLGENAIYWVMLPAGAVTDETIDEITGFAKPGDIVIDGGNSFYKDDIRRAKALREKGLEYVDVGTSGGVWGLERGYCMMIGGDEAVVKRLDPIFATLAPGYGDIARTKGRDAADDRAERGYIHAGPAGAGHFVKMVHNGIEYGLMQAYAEGFDILKNKASERLPEDERFTLNLPDIAEVWRRGSVVQFLAAGPQRPGPGPGQGAGSVHRQGRRQRRRPLDHRRRPWKKPCPPMCCRPRSTPATARAPTTPSARSCCRPCASGSAAMSSRRK